jgi:hypothetical protein
MAIIEVSQSERFIPEWNGNRDREAADQIAVEIEFPTVAEMNELKAIKYGTSRDGSDQFTFWLDRKRILERFVRKVANVSVKDKATKEERAITTGVELAHAPKELSGLAEEIATYVVREDRGIQESPKN